MTQEFKVDTAAISSSLACAFFIYYCYWCILSKSILFK